MKWMPSLKRFQLTAWIITGMGLFSVAVANPATLPDETESNALMAIPSVAVMGKIRLPHDEKAVVQSYINSQLALYGLTLNQLAGFPIETQRQILSPGRAYGLSREARRAIIFEKEAVPETINRKVTPNGILDPVVIERYGIELPPSIQQMLKTPSAYKYMLIGSKLILLAPDYSIADMKTDIY
jgi:hypothetical protein